MELVCSLDLWENWAPERESDWKGPSKNLEQSPTWARLLTAGCLRPCVLVFSGQPSVSLPKEWIRKQPQTVEGWDRGGLSAPRHLISIVTSWSACGPVAGGSCSQQRLPLHSEVASPWAWNRTVSREWEAWRDCSRLAEGWLREPYSQ